MTTSPYSTLSVTTDGDVCHVTFSRPEKRNSIDRAFVLELHDLLASIEGHQGIRVVVLAGQNGYWCTGMDFHEFTSGIAADEEPGEEQFFDYAALLRRLTTVPKIVVAQVEGQVLAGGLGLMAACDLVVANPSSQFGLPEALWGLLPAMVMPFLIRRVGFQAAYRLTMTTTTVGAEQARGMSLVDEVDAHPEAAIKRLSRRLVRLHPSTVGQIKAYSNTLAPLNDAMIKASVIASMSASASPMVKRNLERYVTQGLFPWE